MELIICYLILDFCIVQIGRLQSSNNSKSGLEWVEEFSVGRMIEGKIHEAKDYGVVVSFLNHNDVFGFIAQHHCKWSDYISRCTCTKI